MAVDSHNDYLSRTYFPGLDGLRAIAIIAVVWHHSHRADFLPIFNRGFVGVDLFFVLSGYLIVTLLLREKDRHGAISLKNFWMRRFLRLMPAYYALLLFLLCVYTIFKPNDPDTTRLVNGLPIYALYLSNWLHPGANNLGITWSLATEEQFYLIWPLIESLAAPIAALWFWVSALIVNQLINFGVLDPFFQSAFSIDPARYEILDSTFTPILLGVGLAHLLHRPAGYRLLQKVAGTKYAPWTFAVALIGLLSLPVEDISGAFRLTMHILMMLWLASLLLRPQSAFTQALNIRVLAGIGAISYGMYLYHLWWIYAANIAVNRLDLPQSWLQFPIALGATIIFSAISYQFLEKPFLNLRKKFRRKTKPAHTQKRSAV